MLCLKNTSDAEPWPTKTVTVVQVTMFPIALHTVMQLSVTSGVVQGLGK